MLQLQQDKDFEHWGVDFGAVSRKAEELGIHLIRRPVFLSLQNSHAACPWSDTCIKHLMVCKALSTLHLLYMRVLSHLLPSSLPSMQSGLHAVNALLPAMTMQKRAVM